MRTFLKPWRLLAPGGDFGSGDAGGSTAVADGAGPESGAGGDAGFESGHEAGEATSAPPASAEEPGDARGAAAAAAAAERGRSDHTNFMRQAIARAKGQPDGAPGSATPSQPGQPGQPGLGAGPAAPPAAPATPPSLRVLALSDADWQGVDPAQRAALEPILTAKLAELEEQRYLPIARQVFADHQQNMEYFEQVQQVMGSEPYQLAEWLHANPDKYNAVVAMLRGEAGNAGEPALPEIDPSTLDPEARAIYLHAQAARAENQQLRQQLAETLGQIDQRVGAFDEFRQGELARQQSAALSFAEREAASRLTQAQQHAAKVLGFDPAKYTDLMTKAYQTVQAFTAAGHWQVGDLDKNLVEALRMCGAGEIAQRLKAQRNGGVPPPADRAAGGENTHDAFLRGAIASAKREQYGA